MIRIVAAKLVPYRSFWKFLALYAVAVLLAVFVASSLGNITVNGAPLPIEEWFAMPKAWRTVCAIARWLYFIPAFFAVQLICAELELRLVRAHVIAGLEHRDIVGGWTVQNVVLTGVAIVVTCVATLLFASRPDGSGFFEFGAMLRSEAGLALHGLVFLSLTSMCAVLLRRPVPTLALLILWPLALEPLVGYVMDRNGLEAASAYLPFAALGSLLPLSGGEGFNPVAPLTFASLAYGIAATLLTWVRLRQLDL